MSRTSAISSSGAAAALGPALRYPPRGLQRVRLYRRACRLFPAGLAGLYVVCVSNTITCGPSEQTPIAVWPPIATYNWLWTQNQGWQGACLWNACELYVYAACLWIYVACVVWCLGVCVCVWFGVYVCAYLCVHVFLSQYIQRTRAHKPTHVSYLRNLATLYPWSMAFCANLPWCSPNDGLSN